jgi:hypothetical protein
MPPPTPTFTSAPTDSAFADAQAIVGRQGQGPDAFSATDKQEEEAG